MLANRELQNLERLRAVVDTLVDGVVTMSVKGKILDVNPAVAIQFGYSPTELIGKDVSILMPEPHASAHQGYVERYLETGDRRIIGFGRRVQARRKDGSLIHISLAVTETVVDGERVFTGILRDVTSEVLRERELKRRQEELEVETRINEVIQHASTPKELLDECIRAVISLGTLEVQGRVGLFLVDSETSRGSRELERPLLEGGRRGLRLARTIGDFSEEFLDHESWIPMGACLCGRAAETGEVLVSDNCFTDLRHEHRFTQMKAHGHYIIPLKARGSVLGVIFLYTDPDPNWDERRLALLGALGAQIGIALDRLWTNQELQRSREELQRLAIHDELTGLLNRRAILDRLVQEWARFRRRKGRLSVALFDIDRFKRINDTYGHPAGDAVLAETARRAAEVTRTYDQVGRYGGEEFLVILPEADEETASVVAERLREAVAATPIHAGGRQLGVTVSIGVASTSGRAAGGVDEEGLLAEADRALYRAKRAGRNRIELGRSVESVSRPPA